MLIRACARERDSRNFRKFPPSLQYPDCHLFPQCSVVHHIFNFHHVSRFLLQGYFGLLRSKWIPRRCRFIGRRKAVSLTVGDSGWFSRGNESRVPFQAVAQHSSKLHLWILREIRDRFFFGKDLYVDIIFLYNFDIKYDIIDCTSQITLYYPVIVRDFDECAALLTFLATLRACYVSRRLKRRKSEHDGAMFRKSWSWNVKEARGLRRRRMTMPWEKLD